MATPDQQYDGRLYTQAEVDALSKPPVGLGEYTDEELRAELDARRAARGRSQRLGVASARDRRRVT